MFKPVFEAVHEASNLLAVQVDISTHQHRLRDGVGHPASGFLRHDAVRQIVPCHDQGLDLVHSDPEKRRPRSIEAIVVVADRAATCNMRRNPIGITQVHARKAVFVDGCFTKFFRIFALASCDGSPRSARRAPHRPKSPVFLLSARHVTRLVAASGTRRARTASSGGQADWRRRSVAPAIFRVVPQPRPPQQPSATPHPGNELRSR